MRRFVAFVMLSGLACSAVLFDPAVSSAKPEYSRRTKKDCGYCHPKDSYDINEAGRYFRDHNHSLEGFKPSESGGK
jgi:hypothetical protein